jgi:hypothetical protein
MRIKEIYISEYKNLIGFTLNFEGHNNVRITNKIVNFVKIYIKGVNW